jgi:hypothetical protein
MPKTSKQLDDEIADALAKREVIRETAQEVRSEIEHADYEGGRCADASCQLSTVDARQKVQPVHVVAFCK